MKNKFWIITAVSLVLLILTAWSVPAFAATPTGTPGSAITQGAKARILIRLLVVQDEAKLDGLLAKAVTDGKITILQSTKIKEIWTNNHVEFAPGTPLIQTLAIRNGNILKVVLARAVKSGKITTAQATKVKALWTELHTK